MRQPRRTRLLLAGTALFHLLTPHLERLERTLGGDAEHRGAHACPHERLPIAIIEAYVGVGTIMAAVVHLGPDVWRRRIAVRLGQWRRLARLGPAPPLSLQLVVSPTIRELAPTLPTGCAFLDGTLTRVPHTPSCSTLTAAATPAYGEPARPATFGVRLNGICCSSDGCDRPSLMTARFGDGTVALVCCELCICENGHTVQCDATSALRQRRRQSARQATPPRWVTPTPRARLEWP